MNWTDDFNWVCPPVKEIVNVIRHLLLQPCHGILVVPNWPTAMFWHKLTLDGRHLLPMFIKHCKFKPFLYKGADCDNVFQGVPQFLLIGLVFDSSVTHYVAPLNNYCVVEFCSNCGK